MVTGTLFDASSVPSGCLGPGELWEGMGCRHYMALVGRLVCYWKGLERGGWCEQNVCMLSDIVRWCGLERSCDFLEPFGTLVDGVFTSSSQNQEGEIWHSHPLRPTYTEGGPRPARFGYVIVLRAYFR